MTETPMQTRTQWSTKKIVGAALACALAFIVVVSMLTFAAIQLDSAHPLVPYVVQPGDTLSGIAERCRPKGYTIYDYTVEIQLENDLSSNHVHTDQKLDLPGGATC